MLLLVLLAEADEVLGGRGDDDPGCESTLYRVPWGRETVVTFDEAEEASLSAEPGRSGCSVGVVTMLILVVPARSGDEGGAGDCTSTRRSEGVVIVGGAGLA